MRILVFGHSVTQGFDDTEKGGWVSRLFIDIGARKRGDAPDITSIFNLGVSGDTTRELRARIESEIANRAQKDMIIIFDIGENDCVYKIDTGENLVPFEIFSQNYLEMVHMAKAYGPVVCLGLHDTSTEVLDMPYYEGLGFNEEETNKYAAEIKKIAEENDAVYVEMKGILSSDFDNLTYDGDHPSAAGHELIYQKVKVALVENKLI